MSRISGMDDLQSFSKIKGALFPWGQALSKTKNKLQFAQNTVVRSRWMNHGLMVLIVTASSFSGLTAQAISGNTPISRSNNNVLASETSDVFSIASIAVASGSLVAEDAIKLASEKANEISIPTTDGDFLSKKVIISTEGTAMRDTQNYVVQGGDTLAAIAEKFGITPQTIKWANQIEDETAIKQGQFLAILPVSGVVHTVKNGDTLAAIASKYQADQAQLVSFNNLENRSIAEGMQIIVPGGKIEGTSKPQSTIKATSPTQPKPQPTKAPALASFFGNSYSYGYCTWYVASRIKIPSNWGNGGNWAANAAAQGYKVDGNPTPGSIWSIWNGNWAGHSGIVEDVDLANGRMLVSDMNGPAGWGRVATYWTSIKGSFIHL